MGNIGDAISESAPALATSGPGYASTINALLTEFKTRMTAKIPLSSLLTSGTLDLNGQPLTNAQYITLNNTASTPGPSPIRRLTAYQDNLWYVGASGALKITDGLSLNATAIGGITGDYSSAGPMQFRYDLANTRYDAFANQSTNTWAYVRARGFDIANSATGTNRLRQLYATAANADLTWTDPTSGTSFGNGCRVLAKDNLNNIIFSPAIPQDTATFYPTRYKVLSAVDIFNNGFYSGTTSIGISVASNLYRVTLPTAGDYVDVPFRITNEGSTVLVDNPITINAVRWKGDKSGGGYPTLEVYYNKSTAPFDTTAITATSQTMSTLVAANSGSVDTVRREITTPIKMTGDQFIHVRIIASTNNLHTHYLALEYSKQS